MSETDGQHPQGNSKSYQKIKKRCCKSPIEDVDVKDVHEPELEVVVNNGNWQGSHHSISDQDDPESLEDDVWCQHILSQSQLIDKYCAELGSGAQ